MLDARVKAIKNIYSLAVQVENNKSDKIELELCLDFLNELATQYRKEENCMVDLLIILKKVEEFDKLDARFNG